MVPPEADRTETGDLGGRIVGIGGRDFIRRPAESRDRESGVGM